MRGVRSHEFWQEVEESGSFWKVEKRRVKEQKAARKPFSCPKCGLKVPSEGGVREHLKQVHDKAAAAKLR
jgi:hypothetical protein